jgi:DNA gyrase/topoisomerase IV subunit A
VEIRIVIMLFSGNIVFLQIISIDMTNDLSEPITFASSENDISAGNDLPSASPSFAIPLKVSDDSNSDEILIFTDHCNVYKVPKKDIKDKFQALQKIEPEEGERPIYLTGDKNYTGFLIAAFENGKIAKITMTSYRTEFKRKKLKNAYNGNSELIFIERFGTDEDLVTMSDIKKVVLFNTSLINPVESRTAMGVQVMKGKKGSLMVKVKKASQVKLADPEYYRRSEGLNVVGFYLREGDTI